MSDDTWQTDFRPILPGKAHCNRCHGLVDIEDAFVTLAADGGYVFRVDSLKALLVMHRDVTCPRADPAVPA